MRQYLPFVTLLITVFNCTTPDRPASQTTIDIPARPLYAASPIAALLDSLRPAKQHFTISGDVDTLLTSSGSAIAIDANTFINASGEIVQGKVDLEIVEAISFPDMLGAGLQTTSQGRILQTSGMIYINASSNGKPLAIRKEKPITVALKGYAHYKDSKVFAGAFDTNGNIDWTEKSNLDAALLTFPVELIDIGGGWECWYNDQQIASLKNKKYENTYIATREFESRMMAFSYAVCDQMKDMDDEIIQIYTSNTHKALYVADSLVAAHINTKYRNLVDTVRYSKQFSDSWWVTEIFKDALAFYKQRLTLPIDFAALGITVATTTDQLIKRGHTEYEATKLINLYKIRKKQIQSRSTRDKAHELLSSIFPITEVGWANVDRFMNDPEAKESKFTVTTNSKDSLNFVAMHLYIPSHSIVVTGWSQGKGDYTFTNKQAEYRKLPVGQNAVIVALSYQDETPYVGLREIKIPASGIIHLEMKPTTAGKITAQLSRYTFHN
jgi:hypothetical protein